MENYDEIARKYLRIVAFPIDNEYCAIMVSYATEELKPSDLCSFILDDVIIGHLIEQDCLFFNYAK